jgi:arylsulfatase A-like enzyme
MRIATLCAALLIAGQACAQTTARPNIILLVADDLGYGDLGSYGQRAIRTPHLDRLAAEGLRFTRFYAGSTVCAPSRCVLMTGLNTGRCRVRGNGDPTITSLTPQDTTVAQVLRVAGYSTAIIGKWGLGDEGFGGLPDEHGFDYFYGYLNHIHAHNYYPRFLWRNRQKAPLRNVVRDAQRGYGGFIGGAATQKIDYAHDLFVDEALQWIEQNKAGPFFLFLPLTIPHANNEAGREGMEVPDLGEYADRDWPEPEKGKAAMITRMDRDIGRLIEKLRALGIDKKTLVLFTSDNGPHREGGVDPDFLNSRGPLRGIKRDLYEGGIRVPLIAWRPGVIHPGATTDHIAYFGDVIATFAELAGTEAPSNLDSESFAPLLEGKPAARDAGPRELYWEFYERQGGRALVEGSWKAIRPTWHAPVELYNLEADEGEQRDLAAHHAERAQRMARRMDELHAPSRNWPVPPLSKETR